MANRPQTRDQSGLLWAISLILGGVLLLLYNFDLLVRYQIIFQYGLPGLGLASGIGFFAGYFTQRSHWWRLIPAWTLTALAGMIYLSTLENVDQRLTASLLFVAQSIAFIHIYLLDRQERWWALIPGGFMLVIGGVIGLSVRTSSLIVLGSALFVGLGVVFLVLYLLGERRRLWWALIPGTVLIIFGIFLYAGGLESETLIVRWWPLGLIFIGLLLGWRSLRARKPKKLTVNQAPPLRSTKSSGKKDTPSPSQLGQYTGPAPGASVDLLSDADDRTG